MVAAIVRTIFAQPGQGEVRAHVDRVADMLGKPLPAVTAMLLEAKADLTAFAGFPHAHWRKFWSTRLERLNREVKRRTDVFGIFPNPDARLRLSACVLIEAHDEWQDSDRCYLSEESMALLTPPPPTALSPGRDEPSEVNAQPALHAA
jgi:putative transposase